MGQLGVNAHGEILETGRVPDCYLGLLLDPADDAEGAGVLVVAPAALLHPGVPQLDGRLLYGLLTGYPDRTPRQLAHAYRRWRHPSSGRRAGDLFL